MGDLPVVTGIYDAFTKPNFRGSRLMSEAEFKLLCKTTNLFDRNFKDMDATVAYWRAQPTGMSGLTNAEFELALMYVAIKKKLPTKRVFDQVTLSSIKSIFKAQQTERKAVEQEASERKKKTTTTSNCEAIMKKCTLMKKQFISMPPGKKEQWEFVPDASFSHRNVKGCSGCPNVLHIRPDAEPERYRAADNRALSKLAERVEHAKMMAMMEE